MPTVWKVLVVLNLIGVLVVAFFLWRVNAAGQELTEWSGAAVDARWEPDGHTPPENTFMFWGDKVVSRLQVIDQFLQTPNPNFATPLPPSDDHHLPPPPPPPDW
jgi:hypothetical protein